MEYNFELFTTSKENSFRTSYRYLLKGAFYDVYSNGYGDYHMAKEFEPSLKERIWFYQNKITKHPYPVFNQNHILEEETHANSYILMLQVLGLPEEMLAYKDPLTKITRILTPEEILSRIKFEEGLFFGYGPEDITDSIVDTSDYCVIGLINHWIENGYYFPNPERLFQTEGKDFSYPVYVDERKIPEKYKKLKITPERLVIDFAQEPLLIDKSCYDSEFKPLNEMPYEDWFDIAFNSETYEKQSVLALQNYFSAILKDLANEFFKIQYQQEHVFSYSALDEDFELYHENYPFLAIGSRFNMPRCKYRKFTKEENGIQESFDEGNYGLFFSDLPAIEDSYRHVMRFLELHPRHAYMPFVVIRLLGLPFRAFEKARYFDFKQGSFKQFISLFEIVNQKSDRECGIYITRDNDGTILLLDAEKPDNLRHMYLLDQSGKGLIMSDYDWVLGDPFSDTLLLFRLQGKQFEALQKGDRSLCFSLLDQMQKEAYEDKMTGEGFATIRSFLLEEESKGCLPSIKNFFERTNEGYTIQEAASKTMLGRTRFPYHVFLSFIGMMIVYLIGKKESAYKTKLKKEEERHLFEFGKAGEEFIDSYLPHPHVFKGRYFLFYLDNDRIYCDAADKTAVQNMEAIYRKFCLKRHEYPFTFSCAGKEKCCRKETGIATDYLSEFYFLGIPEILIGKLDASKSPMEQIVFEENIGILNRKDHESVLKIDPTLHDYPIYSKAIASGILLIGKTEAERAVYPLRDRLNPTYRYLLSPDFIRNYLANPRFSNLFNGVHGQNTHKKMGMFSMDDFFRHTLLKVLDGELPPGNSAEMSFMNENKTVLDIVMISYGGIFLRSLYLCLEKEIYGTENNAMLLSIPQENGRVSIGGVFVAYGKTEDISGFYLDIQDKELIFNAIQAALKISNEEKSDIKSAYDVTALLGIPPVMKKQTFRLLESPLISEHDLEEVFKFKEKPTDINASEYTGTNSDYYYQRMHYADPYNNTWIRHEALRQGYFIGAYEDVVSLLSDSDMEMVDMGKCFRKIQNLKTYVFENLCDECKMNFLPTRTGFASQVDAFIQLVPDVEGDHSYSIYLKEMLHELYRKDSMFLVNGINWLHSKDKHKFFTEILKRVVKFGPQDDFEPVDGEEIIYGIALFLYCQERQAVIDLTHRMYE